MCCHTDGENFAGKEELFGRLGIIVIPSEDLKTRKIKCCLEDKNEAKKEGENGLAKVTFCGVEGVRTPYLLTASEAFSQLNYDPINVNNFNRNPRIKQV
jgi:hypothetical protein